MSGARKSDELRWLIAKAKAAKLEIAKLDLPMDAYQSETRRIAKTLAEEEGGRFHQDWNGYRLRLGGVTSSCTSSVHGLLFNWLSAAERKLDALATLDDAADQGGVKQEATHD